LKYALPVKGFFACCAYEYKHPKNKISRRIDLIKFSFLLKCNRTSKCATQRKFNSNNKVGLIKKPQLIFISTAVSLLLFGFILFHLYLLLACRIAIRSCRVCVAADILHHKCCRRTVFRSSLHIESCSCYGYSPTDFY
jgi:hypothetical protein